MLRNLQRSNPLRPFGPAPLDKGSLESAQVQSLPSQGRWLGEAETERLQQICDDLSVCFADSIPTPFVPSGHFPLIGGIGPWKGSQGGPANTKNTYYDIL